MKEEKNKFIFLPAETPKTVVLSFFLGLISLLEVIPLELFSIVCGIIGLHKVKKHNLPGKKEATFGIIISIVSLARTAIIFLVLFFSLHHFIDYVEKDFELMNSKEMSIELQKLYTDEYQHLVFICPPEFKPYLGKRIIITEEEFAKFPESLQKALSVNYDSIQCPKPSYPRTGTELYAIELYEDSFKIFVVSENEEWLVEDVVSYYPRYT